jgi:hypothetical protein
VPGPGDDATAAAAAQEAHIDRLPEPRRVDVRRLHELIRATVPGLEPTMDARMLGYGPYHYRYASGREGDGVQVGLASNKHDISLYVVAADESGYLAERYAERLGKASCGRSCIRFKRLDDIDLDVVRQLLREAERMGPPASS